MIEVGGEQTEKEKYSEIRNKSNYPPWILLQLPK